MSWCCQYKMIERHGMSQVEPSNNNGALRNMDVHVDIADVLPRVGQY